MEIRGQAAKEKGFTLVRSAPSTAKRRWPPSIIWAAQGAQGFIICTPDVKLGPAIVRALGGQ